MALISMRQLLDHAAEHACGVSVEAMRDICIAHYEAFGTAGNADKIRVNSLAVMQTAYDAGQLKPLVH